MLLIGRHRSQHPLPRSFATALSIPLRNIVGAAALSGTATAEGSGRHKRLEVRGRYRAIEKRWLQNVDRIDVDRHIDTLPPSRQHDRFHRATQRDALR